MRRPPRWIWPGMLYPALLGVACAVAGMALPDDSSAALYAGIALLTLARVAFLLYPLWALIAIARHRWVVVPVLVGAAGFLVAGVPGVVDREAPGTRVVIANVLYGGDEVGELEDGLSELEPDVLITLERELVQLDELDLVATNRGEVDERWKAAAAFCRPGRCEAVVQHHGADACRMPVVLVRHDSGICVVGLHVPPPGPEGCPASRAPYVASVAGRIDDGRVRSAWGPCRAGDPVIVGGDLNAVAGQDAYQALNGPGLRDPLLPAGIWARTFPDGGGKLDVPLVRIDHVLVGPLDLTGVSLVSLPDTDHKAIVLGVEPRSAPTAQRR